jgi:hypothetical protein
MSIISYILPSRRLDLLLRSAETFLHLRLSDYLAVIRFTTLTHKARIRVWSTPKCKAGKTLLGTLWPYSTSPIYANHILRRARFNSTVLIFHALRAQRLLNSPESAYRSETGGLMTALRKLTVEQSDGFLCSSRTQY